MPVVSPGIRAELEPTPRFSHVSAGFSEVRTEKLRTVLRYESADAACGVTFAGGPVALAYSRFNQRTRDEAHAEYVASIEPFRTAATGGYEIPGEFVIARGVRA